MRKLQSILIFGMPRIIEIFHIGINLLRVDCLLIACQYQYWFFFVKNSGFSPLLKSMPILILGCLSKSDQIPILQNWWISILGRLWILRFFLFFFLHQYWYWVLNVPLGTERTLQTEVPFMLLILDDWEPILKYVKNELISILTHVRKTANLKCARWRKKMVGFLIGYIYKKKKKNGGFFCSSIYTGSETHPPSQKTWGIYIHKKNWWFNSTLRKRRCATAAHTGLQC